MPLPLLRHHQVLSQVEEEELHHQTVYCLSSLGLLWYCWLQGEEFIIGTTMFDQRTYIHPIFNPDNLYNLDLEHIHLVYKSLDCTNLSDIYNLGHLNNTYSNTYNNLNDLYNLCHLKDLEASTFENQTICKLGLKHLLQYQIGLLNKKTESIKKNHVFISCIFWIGPSLQHPCVPRYVLLLQLLIALDSLVYLLR